MSRSDSYMKSPKALYKRLNLLGEICFDLIIFCQDERTCVMYLSKFLYLSYGVFGSSIYKVYSNCYIIYWHTKL